MSDGEIASCLFWSLAALGAWGIWLYHASLANPLVPRGAHRLLLYIGPAAALLVLAVVLRTWASHDVRDAGEYLFMYGVMGLGWSGIASLFFPFLGLSLRDDAVERGNAGASLALAAAVVGVTAAFAGANVGDGPGWWVVVFCGGLATAAWFVTWALLERFTGVADVITIERDASAGARLAGFLVAAGVVTGRAAAGNWTGAGPALSDFGAGSAPLLPLLVAAVLIERLCAPTARRPRLPLASHGVLPAIAYVGAAASWLLARPFAP